MNPHSESARGHGRHHTDAGREETDAQPETGGELRPPLRSAR
ncbi:hypothetical protein ACFWWA_29820 [Streptomyces goshikiensis]